MSEYVIEKGVPIPVPATSGNIQGKTGIFRSMEVGDSFFVRGATPTSGEVRSWRQTAINCGGRAAVRSVEGGCRIWRTK